MRTCAPRRRSFLRFLVKIRWLPDLTRAGDVTIRQILSMTSGYQDFWPQDYVMPMMMQPVTAPEILTARKHAAELLDAGQAACAVAPQHPRVGRDGLRVPIQPRVEHRPEADLGAADPEDAA